MKIEELCLDVFDKVAGILAELLFNPLGIRPNFRGTSGCCGRNQWWHRSPRADTG